MSGEGEPDGPEGDEAFGAPRSSRPAKRPPPPAHPIKITFKDLRREPDARPEGTEEIVDPRILMASGVTDAVRERLTAPPPVPSNVEAKATALIMEMRLCGPDDHKPFVERLVALGTAAIPVVARHFPGGRWFDRHAAHRRPPHGSEVSPVAAALVAFGPPAAEWVAALLEADHPDLRYYASLVAHELGHPSLVVPLGRLVFEHDEGVREVAVDALNSMRDSAEFAVLRATLVSAALSSATYTAYRRRAIEALTVVRDVGAVEVMVELAGDPDGDVADTARDALVVMTGHDLGSVASRWRSWWARHRDAHRVEWLLDGLGEAEASVRAVAADELRRATGQAHGFDAKAKKAEREIGVRAWRAWWAQQAGSPPEGHR